MSTKQVIWTTQMVSEAAEKINNGFILKKYENPFFERTVGIRNYGLAFSMSNDEKSEYIKCALDIHYFAEKYCYVKGDDGHPIKIPLRDYQKEILDNFYKERFNILMAARQSGKTICSSISMLHYALFNNNKNVLITANKLDTAVEVIDKMKEIYQRLPFFLQQGVINWAQKLILFENKSRIKGFATTKNSSIGQTADFLYLDEFAHLANNIAEKFYKSVFPTVSNIDNSKIIITSTPNGYNLFHKLLTDAEKPEDEKSSYVAKRVYWWQVPKRFVTYIRLNSKKMEDVELTKEEIYSHLSNKYPENKIELKYMEDKNQWTINVFNSDQCKEEDILSESVITKHREVKLLEIAIITTWKKETIKDIGGEEAFNQEYDLRFINSSRSLLSEHLIKELSDNKKIYEWEQIPELDSKLKFSYQDLKWIKDLNIYDPSLRKLIKVIISVDISEGLGQDFSVINIFKVSQKNEDEINHQLNSIKDETSFFKLEQIGMFRSNIISVGQLSEILYLICFEHFNSENVKVVLEINTYGNELLAHMPNVFDGVNEYGSSIFIRYKHRSDSIEEKIGIKIGDNKNLLVKSYQEKMEEKSISISNDVNIQEITTFIKHTTSAGNIRYAADGSSKDDTVMTLVSLSSVFDKNEYRQLIDEYLSENPSIKNNISNILSGIDPENAIDYSSMLSTRKNILSSMRQMRESKKSIESWISKLR